MKKAFSAQNTGACSYEKQSNSSAARVLSGQRMTQCNRS